MKRLFYLSIAVLMATLSVLSCKKSEENEDLHAVTKNCVVKGNTATMNGAFSLEEGETLSEAFFLVSENGRIPIDGSEKKVTGSQDGQSFSGKISSLKYATDYYYRAVTIVNDKTYNGRIKSFRTEDKAVTGVSLDKSFLTLLLNQTGQLKATITPDDATNQRVTWKSEPVDIVSIKDGVVTALKKGKTTVTVTTDNGKKTATCTVRVMKGECPEGAVDLGLSVYWAPKNLGASGPSDYGDYYAWGETSPKDQYTENTYTYKDNPAVLPPDHDAVTVNWKGNWRIATREEWNELFSNCTVSKVSLEGNTGFRFTSKVTGFTDKWIFIRSLPTTSGFFRQYFWTSSIVADENNKAFMATCYYPDESYTGRVARFDGYLLRPVSD